MVVGEGGVKPEDVGEGVEAAEELEEVALGVLPGGEGFAETVGKEKKLVVKISNIAREGVLIHSAVMTVPWRVPLTPVRNNGRCRS